MATPSVDWNNHFRIKITVSILVIALVILLSIVIYGAVEIHDRDQNADIKDCSSCPVDLGYVVYNATNSNGSSLCLKLFVEEMHQPDAVLACENLCGGHLVAVTDISVLTIVRILATPLSDSIWIDGYEDTATGKYLQWNGAEINYPPWQSGHPEQDSKCVRLSKSSGHTVIKTKDCMKSYAFICQKEM